MTAYYNEIDHYCAAWLQNLMDAGHIAPGVIDTRSIEDVRPDELAGYTQCHFFAGIGVWSLALRAAGWPDSRRAWTGSCPCQPFSAAGKGAGFADERHLWPAWQHLIAQCRPPVIFGEQVASKAVDAWIDLVHADLEGMGYAFGGIAFPSAGVGAPHIRDRTFWVGDADRARLEGHAGHGGAAGWQGSGGSTPAAGVFVRVGNATGAARERDARSVLGSQAEIGGSGCVDGHQHVGLEHAGSGVLRLADADGWINGTISSRPDQRGLPQGNGCCVEEQHAAGPTNGFWRAADWLGCTDGKWRPVEPGTFPLAHGATSRVGRLRAYGNAINAQAAQAFIGSYAEARGLIFSEVAMAA